jgi:hypothetical protein
MLELDYFLGYYKPDSLIGISSIRQVDLVPTRCLRAILTLRRCFENPCFSALSRHIAIWAGTVAKVTGPSSNCFHHSKTKNERILVSGCQGRYRKWLLIEQRAGVVVELACAAQVDRALIGCLHWRAGLDADPVALSLMSQPG